MFTFEVTLRLISKKTQAEVTWLRTEQSMAKHRTSNNIQPVNTLRTSLLLPEQIFIETHCNPGRVTLSHCQHPLGHT
jgi:hypothetical protein